MKTAFITGARGGLGLALAREFASAGWGLILHSRRPMDHAGFDFKTLFLTGDFSNPMTVDHCVDFIGKRAVDVLVNNAAAYDTGRVEEFAPGTIRSSLDVNLLAPILLTRALLPKLAWQGGLVVNITSIAAQTPGPDESLYATAKAGLQAFSAALNRESQRTGARAIDVRLGAMNTGFCPDRQGRELCIDPTEAARTIATATQAAFAAKSLILPVLEIRRSKY